MKNRTRRWLILARNWGIFFAALLTVWLIVKAVRPNVNYAIKDKYFHRRTTASETVDDIVRTEYIEDICDPDTQIAVYQTEDIKTGKADGITYTDGLYVLSGQYYIQGEDFEKILTETEIPGYGSVRMVPHAGEALTELLDTAEKETGMRFTLGESYVEKGDADADHGNDCYMLAYDYQSEHITGLSVDLLIDGTDYRTYMKSPLAKWLQDNAYRFGFIIRYPFWEGEWTGVFFQPWHLHYVGAPHASMLYESRLSLEEYLKNYYPLKTYSIVGDYVIYRQNAANGTLFIPTNLTDVEVSFDNTTYSYFVTGRLTPNQ